MRHTLLGAAALVFALTSGCGGGSGSDDTASAPAPSRTPTAASTTSSVTGEWRKAAAGELGQQFLARLADVGPGLDDERSLNRVLDTCLDLSQGGDAIESTKARFSGGTTGDLTDDQAKAIVKAATDYICPDL